MTNLKLKSTIRQLNQSFEEGGYIFNLRYRVFHYEQGEKFLSLLKTIDLSKSDYFDKELVRLLWFIPLFLEWRKTDFKEQSLLNGDEYIRFDNQLTNIQSELDRIITKD